MRDAAAPECSRHLQTSPDRPFFSLVVPAYNEAERLSVTIPRMRRALARFMAPEAYEIVVVDDGSRDETARAAEALLDGVPHRVISYRPNRGKGRAVKVGMLEARGSIRLMSDADLSTPLEEIPRFLAAHRRGYDVVIGSRKRPGARVERRQPWIRESMGRVFTLLSATLVVSGISDFTCGFKSFTARATDLVFPPLALEDWSYDTELLWRVRRTGLSLKELPVRWLDDPATRVHACGDALRSLRALLGLLLIRCRGDVDGRP